MSSLIFKTVGPFEIEMEKNSDGKFQTDSKKIRKIFDSPEGKSLAQKQGCYVFAIGNSEEYTPWFIGKSTKSFEVECATKNKIWKYNKALSYMRKGTPYMFFITTKDQKTKIPAAICNELESTLIQYAAIKNDKLTNGQKKKTPNWGIEGVLRGSNGRPTKEENALKSMLNI